MPAINLPLRATPNLPWADWTSPDWEDNGWNKAMREVAFRLNNAGIPVVILEAKEPNSAMGGRPPTCLFNHLPGKQNNDNPTI